MTFHKDGHNNKKFLGSQFTTPDKLVNLFTENFFRFLLRVSGCLYKAWAVLNFL